MIWQSIGRFFRICFGFALALLGAFVTLFLAGSKMMAEQFNHNDFINNPAFDTILNYLSLGVEILPVMTLLPALLALLIAELGKIRSIYYYLLAGGISFVFGPLAHLLLTQKQTTIPNPRLFAIFLTAGFVGGFIYWLIAGRKVR